MGEGKARFARSGPMTLFLAGIAGNPNPFATRPIHFATPHTYTGGALLFETRSSSQTTPLLNDSSAVVEYGGGLFNVADPDALVGDIPNPGSNWAMELHVLRGKTAPRIVFAGKPKLKGGRARVTGTVSETGTRERARHAMPLQCFGKWRGKVLLARDGMRWRSNFAPDGWPLSRTTRVSHSGQF